MILDGECDDLSEQSLYMIGPIEEAFEKDEGSEQAA
jgi:F0F1-type ATP synthase beta subunit